MKNLTVLTLLSIGLISFGKGSYLQSKAVVAQWLIAESWSTRAAGRAAATPWRWADMNVIAKLDVPRLHQTRYIMNSASGQALAFGPGHLSVSTLPGEIGHSVIAGHRDSHFQFLRDVELGDSITTQNYRSQTIKYRVVDIQLIDTRIEQIPIFELDLLTLVTCYPFDSFVPRGPLRYLVTAEKESNQRNQLPSSSSNEI